MLYVEGYKVYITGLAITAIDNITRGVKGSSPFIGSFK